MTGQMGCLGVMLAVYNRMRTGVGQRVQACLSRSSTLAQLPYMLSYEGKVWDEPAGPNCTGFGPLNRIFRSADGSFFLRAESPAALRSVPGLSNLPDDPEECASALERHFSGGSAADWVRLLHAPGVVARRCRVYSRDPVNEPYAQMRGLAVWEYHPGMGIIRTNHCTSRMSLTPPQPGYPSPAPGMDTDWFVKQYKEKHNL